MHTTTKLRALPAFLLAPIFALHTLSGSAVGATGLLTAALVSPAVAAEPIQSESNLAERLAALEARVKELESRRVVGVVDLRKLFDGLAEAAEWDVRIKALEAKAMDEGRARKAELDAGAKELEAMPNGAEKDAKLDELRLKKLQAEQWAAMKEIEVDRERSLKLQSIYRHIREAAKTLVDSGKYALVVMDDSRTELQTQRGPNTPSQEAQMLGQILQLRVLGATRTVDVTEEIRVWLDNRQSSGAKDSATTAAPKSPTSSSPSSSTSSEKSGAASSQPAPR